MSAYWRVLHFFFFFSENLTCVYLFAIARNSSRHRLACFPFPRLSPDHPGRQRQWPVVEWQPSAWLQSQRSAQFNPYVPSCMEDSSESMGNPMRGDQRGHSQPFLVLYPPLLPNTSATCTIIISDHVFLPLKCRLQEVGVLNLKP